MKAFTPVRIALVVLAVLLCGARAGLADTLSIIVTSTGTDYYQWNITVGSNNFSSGWVTQTPTQTNYDDMTTSPGGASTVGNTQFFSLNPSADPGLSYTAGGETVDVALTGSSYWRDNNSGGTQAALIVTNPGTPSSSSTVQNLLVLDGTGGIFLYKAPTLNGSGVVTNTNPSGVNAYGYESAWNPATQGTPLNVPITQLGSLTSGLEGALESNTGFYGPGAPNTPGSNFAAGGETTVSLPGGPVGLTSFLGYEFAGANQPNSVREFVNGSLALPYLTPTIYFDEAPVPTPEPASIGLLVGASILLLGRRRWLS